MDEEPTRGVRRQLSNIPTATNESSPTKVNPNLKRGKWMKNQQEE